MARTLVAGVLAGSLVAVPALGLAAPAGAAPAAAVRPASASSTIASLAASALEALQRLEALRAGDAMGDAGSAVAARLVDERFDTRERLAGEVATGAGVDPDALLAAWRSTSEQREAVVYAALAQVGTPYHSARSEPGLGFDCSGLTMYAWGTVGVALPHNDWSQVRASFRRDLASAQPGDLVQYPGHVMLYLGVERAVVHAPYTGRTVELYTANRIANVVSPVA